jgi:MFS family permease
MENLDTHSQPATGYLELIRQNRNYRFLWLGEVISYLGDWFNLIASAALVAQLTDSGLAIGGLFVIRTLAPFLVSPLAGVLADRYDRKRILIISDLLRMAIVFCFLLVRRPEHVWLLYALTALQLGVSGFFVPARGALLPTLVSGRELGTANALGSATWSTMLAIGAGLGGLVSGLIGIYPAFAIDGLTFLVSALLIWQIAAPETEQISGDKTIMAGLKQYLEGLRYLKDRPDILMIAMQKAMLSLVNFTAFQVIQVSIAEQVFVLGAGGGIGLGLMFGFGGLGSALSPIIARRFSGDREPALRRAILVGYVVAAVGLLIAAPLASFGLVLLGATTRAVGGAVIWVFTSQLLLQKVPNRVQGRVFASEFAMFTLAGAVGSGVVGRLIDGVGISASIYWLAGLTLLPGMMWAIWLIRGRRLRLATDEAS